MVDTAARAVRAGHTGFAKQRELKRLSQTLVEAVVRLDSESDADTLLQSFADLLVDASARYKLAWFYIGDPDAEEIRPSYCAGPRRDYGEALVVNKSAVMMRGPVREALGSGEPVIQNIPSSLPPLKRLIPGVARWHRTAIDAGVRAVLALPFQLPNRSDWGLTLVYADREGYFDEVGLEPFRALGRLVQVGLDRIALREAEARSRRDIERVRLEDPLTGIPNRAGFEQALERAQQTQDWLLLQVDLDGFGALNAGGGEALGDAVLQAVAQRLQTVAGGGGLVGRSGADEFLLAVTAAETSGLAVAEACQRAIAQPLRVNGTALALSAAIGATRMASNTRFNDHQRELTLAVGRARHAGPGSCWIYDPDRDGDRHVPQGLLAELRLAMTENEFELWYQPQVTLDTPRPQLAGVEALLRWRRRDGTLVPPGAFIPAAEGAPDIRDIGNWVVNETLRVLSGWGSDAPPRVGVNIGARHLLHPRFIEEVRGLLSRYPAVEPQRLTVEITETAALTNPEDASRMLAALRELGVAVALDDFGTGHASLIHLQSLPLDYIKMDRSFVNGINDNSARHAIAEGLMVTARGLGLGVIAEGIETEAEAQTLQDLGCRLAQGYFYARPLPIGEFRAWVREGMLSETS